MDRTGKLDKSKIKFTQWLIELVVLITRDGTAVDDIALTHSLCEEYFEAGHTPEYVYNTIWEKDAGYFYKIW